MPSLNDLGEFKFSFNNIANEKDDVLARKLPFDDLALPDTEAEPFEFSRTSPPSLDSDDLFAPNSDDMFEAEPDTETDAGDFDFSAFLGGMGGTEPPPIDDILEEDFMPTPEAEDEDTSDTESPEDFLPDSSLGDDFPMPDEDASFGLEDASPEISEDFGGIEPETDDAIPSDFDEGSGETGSEDFDGIDLGGESPESSFEGESPDDTQDFESSPDGDSGESFDESIDLGGEGLEDNFNIPQEESFSQDMPSGDTGDLTEAFDLSEAIDMATESSDFEGEAGEDTSGDFSLPDTDFDNEAIDPGTESADFEGEAGEDTSGDFSLPDTDFEDTLPDTDFSNMDISSDFSDALPDTDFDTGDGSDFMQETGDGGDLDLGDLLGDFSSESIELETETQAGPQSLDSTSGGDFGSDGASDDFALPGLEDLFDKSKTETTTQPAPKKGFFKKKAVEVAKMPEAEDIEEIRLTQEDLNRLLKTLQSYPLNLRIACQELIAEQVLKPQDLSKIIRLLVHGAHVKETAAFAEELLGRKIVIPKSFEKMSGAAFEAEQASFAYIFVHNFLPVLRLFAVIAAFLASVAYLGYNFIYIPIRAEGIYRRGYERIPVGEYQRANQLFNEAFTMHRKRKWFYLYAEAFRDQRRYLLAAEKYEQLLRHYPRDKKGVLDYAYLNTYYLLNFEMANRLLQEQLLDYAPDDFDGLLAAGDNFLAWADSDPNRFFDRYEDARFSYARLLELYGWQAPIVERMMKFFIRTDNLREVLHLRAWFENNNRHRLSTETLTELGGYLLDKQLQEVRGVPDPYIESIESVRAMLLQAVREEPTLPEPHYHLARYHHDLGNTYEERLTLENAIRAFDLAQTESVRRRLNRVDTHFRYSNLLVNNREFFPAEEQLVRGIQLYEDFVSRNLIRPTAQLGQLYAAKGDLEYFVKTGDMRAALSDYHRAERYGFSPPEVQFRMGAAYYQLEDWRNSLEYLFRASTELPLNRRMLYALGNVAYQRGDYFAAQGYYNRLIDLLESQRVRFPVLLPNDNPQFLELGERLMMARNNAGVVYEALAEQTGNREFRSRALGLYAESARAWDSITRNPQTMVRMSLVGTPGAPGINLGYLNAGNAMRSAPNVYPQIFVRIDRDILEPSRWEELAPGGDLQ